MTTVDSETNAVYVHGTTYFESNGMNVACVAPTTDDKGTAWVTAHHLSNVGCNADESPCSTDVS